jgi:hypothetical protein
VAACFVAAFLLIAAVPCSAHAPEGPASNEQVFQALWDTLDRGYGLFAAKNVDWDGQYELLYPRAKAARNDAELFDVLASMLSSLNDKHVWLIGTDRAWNCRMKSACPLERVDETIRAWKSPLSERLIEERYLHGKSIRFSQEIMAGYLSSGVGYLRISAFADDPGKVGAATDNAIAMLERTEALVVDVRDNRGGSDQGVKAVADRFADRRRLFMTARVRRGPHRDDFAEPVEWWVEPGVRPYLKPVLLLVNGDTFSAGETFVFAMRVLPHVTVAGERTAGAFSDAADATLPNGWKFSYSIGEWRDGHGILWEGQGLAPDVFVTNSLAGLLHGTDEALDWAIQRLTER